MAVNVPGLVAIILFYLAVFVVGIIAARLTRKRKSKTEAETIMVGGKDIGIVVGFFTLAATWIGADYVNGVAEAVYTPFTGLMWALCITFGYGSGLFIFGIFFVDKIRDNGYTTIADSYQAKLGKYMGAALGMVEILCLVIFTGASLNAIGGSLEIVTGLTRVASVLISAFVALMYTMVGGLYSVAYTDVLQMLLIAFGIILCLPFAFNHEAVTSITETSQGETGWIGTWNSSVAGSYIDLLFQCIFGSIPWQAIVQRVIAAKSNQSAKILCIASSFGSSIMIIPPILIGAVGASTNWTLTNYMNGSGTSPYDVGDQSLILPIVLLYLTPPVVAFFGLGSVAAAIMSSADSATLACGSLFGKNVYKRTIRPNASDSEMVWVIRISFVVCTSLSAAIALTVDSILALALLAADLMYVLCFPQFVCVIYLNPNVYGSVTGFVIGLLLRLLGGETTLKWNPVITYVGGTNFPHKTFLMVLTFIIILLVSFIAEQLFSKGYIPERYDILKSNLCHGGRSNIEKPKRAPGRNIDLPNVYQNTQAQDNTNEL